MVRHSKRKKRAIYQKSLRNQRTPRISQKRANSSKIRKYQKRRRKFIRRLNFRLILFFEKFKHFLNCSRSLRNFIFLFGFHLPISLFKAIWLENAVPSEISGPSRLYYSSMCLSYENKWLRIFVFFIGKNCLCIGSIVLKSMSHFS